MKKVINEYLVRVSSSKMPIEDKLEMGKDVKLLIDGNCTKKEVYDNQDGSVDILYVVKPIEIVIKDSLTGGQSTLNNTEKF